MFYDLNVPYSETDQNLPRTLAFLQELGYNVVALNHAMTGKLPPDLKCPIPDALVDAQSKLTVLRRVTLTLTDSHVNTRLAALGQEYDILALRPIDERTLQLACSSLDCDIISIDLTKRYPFYFKHKMLGEAIRAGKRFEINYAQAFGDNAESRRNVISNAAQLIEKTRGRNLIICSESKAGAIGCRGPWDAINLATVWGLGQERGHDGMSKEARSVVVGAKLKRTGYRGAVDVIYGGEKPAPVEEPPTQMSKKQLKNKRKAEAMSGEADASMSNGAEKPLSNRERKRQAHQARTAAAANTNGMIESVNSAG